MNTERMLVAGLQAGFAGDTDRWAVNRGGFDGESSRLDNGEEIYHDEWFANRAGGGQELVRVGDKTYTRVYAGGAVSEERLSGLGTTRKEVISFLKKFILNYGDEIRLHSNFGPSAEGDWEYAYKILESQEDISMTTGKETIYYKDELVFQHNFILCPVD